MKKEDKKRQELINNAIIKIEKKHLLERLEEKAKDTPLTKDERLVLIESIFESYIKKRKKLEIKHKLSKNKKNEINRVSFYLLSAIENAIDNNDIQSINLLISQSKLFNEYYDLIMNKRRTNEIQEVELSIRNNNKLIKQK